jgi:lipid A 3-O-deacylase
MVGLLSACLLEVGSPLLGQQQGSTTLLRLYEDDDYLNIRGKGTDDAYTNGSRIDFFYTLDGPSHSLVDKVLPRAGAGSIDVYGWGIMETMFTPKNIGDTAFQPNDYPWSGSLFLTHSRSSYNPVAHYLLQTEVVAGIIGPAAGARPIQSDFHRLIHYQQPRGWRYQFRNDLLLNLNLAFEKQLLALPSGTAGRNWLELIDGTHLSGGTMDNEASLYTLLRIGRMTPYFNGLLSQFSGPSKAQDSHKGQWQLYFTVRPQVTAIATDASLEGGIFSKKPDESIYAAEPVSALAAEAPGSPAKTTTSSASPGTVIVKTHSPYHRLNTLVYNIDCGAVLAFRGFSISYTQDWSSALMKGLYTHQFGNFSLYFVL